MPISTDMIVRIAHADVALHMGFPASVRRWHSESEEDHTWRQYAGACDSLLIGERDAVVIDGDCSNGVSAPDGGVVHIYGDLTSKFDASGHYELVITGDVTPSAKIDVSGHCHVFVGGKFAGELCSTHSGKIWIGSDFDGSIRTGSPSTHLHIGGNYNGHIVPNESAALLYLSVAGFAAQTSLAKIADFRYTEFNASIAGSDVAPGIYPANGHLRDAAGHNSFNRWCVAAESKS